MTPAVTNFEQVAGGEVPVIAIPWRDSHAVAPEDLQQYISMLEQVCQRQPNSASARICLGMAHAVNNHLDRALGALEEARRIEPGNFFAQLKLGEMHCRQHTLERADNETCRAAELAGNSEELSLARSQLAQIRCLRWEAEPRRVRFDRSAVIVLAATLTALAGGILLALR